jgi:lipopolysaccharide transport system permease protein
VTEIQADIGLLSAKPQAAQAASAQPSAPRKLHLRIQPQSGFAALNLREIWQYRDLLWTLGMRDLKLRYRQTALGVIWVVLQPLLGAFILGFVFGRVSQLPTGNVSYFVYSYAGLLAWNAFSGTLSRSSICVVSSSHLVSKVFFPRLILPLSTVFASLIDFIVGLAFMVVLLVCYGIYPGWPLLLLPVWLLMTLLLAIGVGMYTAALMVRWRDLQYVIPVLMQFWLYASPVAYSLLAIPPRFRWAYLLNPMASLLEGFHLSLIGRGTFHWYYLVYACLMSVMVFVFGAVSFRRMERRFADVI